jgi:hypothetical protein
LESSGSAVSIEMFQPCTACANMPTSFWLGDLLFDNYTRTLSFTNTFSTDTRVKFSFKINNADE